MGEKNSLKILNIGCGDKLSTGEIGIDINYIEATHVMDIDKNNIPYPNNYFDKVISDDSIEHFGNPKHVFEEVKRVLKIGGVFRIETVNVSVWWIRLSMIDWNKAWRHKLGTKRTGHLIHWTVDMLRMWYEIHGFKVTLFEGNSLLCYRMIYEGKKLG